MGGWDSRRRGFISINSWDNHLDANCDNACGSNGGFMTNVHSKHNNGKEDRLFNMACACMSAGQRGHGSTYGWTGWDATWTFSCPNNAAISRIRSNHDNGREDRIWYFDCLTINGVVNNGGGNAARSWSGWVNNWDGEFSSGSSGGHVLTGVHSQHDNGREDRLFKFQQNWFDAAPSSCN
jgi:lipoyltransferase 1